MNHPGRTSLLLFAFALSSGRLASAQQEPAITTANEMANGNPVTLGEHSKLTAKLSDRERIRAFYQGVLGCTLTTPSATLDSFQLGSTFNFGIVYDSAGPSAADVFKGIWLELQTDHPEDLKDKILRFGTSGFDYFDKKHFYFQAPGGQVFRIVKTGEVL